MSRVSHKFMQIRNTFLCLLFQVTKYVIMIYHTRSPRIASEFFSIHLCTILFYFRQNGKAHDCFCNSNEYSNRLYDRQRSRCIQSCSNSTSWLRSHNGWSVKRDDSHDSCKYYYFDSVILQLRAWLAGRLFVAWRFDMFFTRLSPAL